MCTVGKVLNIPRTTLPVVETVTMEGGGNALQGGTFRTDCSAVSYADYSKSHSLTQSEAAFSMGIPTVSTRTAVSSTTTSKVGSPSIMVLNSGTTGAM